MLMSPNKGETAVHGCQCTGDMVVRMRKVVAVLRSWEVCSIAFNWYLLRCPFLSSHWIFGQTLDEFFAYSPFLPKFPFFAQNCHFLIIAIRRDFPLSPYLNFCNFWWILASFSNLLFVWKLQLPISLFFFVPFKFFLRPLMNPIQIHQFRKLCHFRKTHDHRHASFFILF